MMKQYIIIVEIIKIKMYAFSPLAKRNGSKRNRILNRDVLKQLYQKYNCNYEKLVLSWFKKQRNYTNFSFI